MCKVFSKMWGRLLSFTLVGAISCLLPIGVGFAEDDAPEAEANAYEFVDISGLSPTEQQTLAAIEAEEAELVAIVRGEGGIEGGEDLYKMEGWLYDLLEYVSKEELKILSELKFDSLATGTTGTGTGSGEEFLGAIKNGIKALLGGKKLGELAIGKAASLINYLTGRKGRSHGPKLSEKFFDWASLIKDVPQIFDKWQGKSTTAKFPWQSGWEQWRPLPHSEPTSASIASNACWTEDTAEGSNIKILTTARLEYVNGDPNDSDRKEGVRITAPRHIHLKASKPGYHTTRDIPVTVTNNTDKPVEIRVYEADNLKKVSGFGPTYLSTTYSLSRNSVPKWTPAQGFNGVTSGSSEISPGTTRLNLRCGIHAPRGRFIKTAAYSDQWGMRVIPSHFSPAVNAGLAISEESIEDIEEMDEEDMEELFALEETKGEDVDVEEIE